jgi:two-component system, LuxR family, sensor kinase FixL
MNNQSVTFDAAANDDGLWPQKTLQVLKVCACTFSDEKNHVLWCSQALQRLLKKPISTVTQLCSALPGLRHFLQSSKTHQQGMQLRCDDQFFQADLCFHSAGLVTLSLENNTHTIEQIKAQQRQLHDREQLLLTSRLWSVNEMASALAHEINQPIGAAVNFLRVATQHLQSTNEQKIVLNQTLLNTVLQRTLEQILFVSRIIARIREYTHERTPQREYIDLEKLLRTCVQLLDWEIEREHISVHFDIEPGVKNLLADELMLQQIFVNLIRNAIDAMRTNVAIKRSLHIQIKAQPAQLEVAISDTGCGITEHVEASLFVPFMSNKNQGMGLGLTICRSLVELHQGRLWFSRNEHQGSTFHVAFPALYQQPLSTLS